MIFDAFLFFNELDLLKIRLEELKDVVDRFVLVQATLTHSGVSKPLYFERYRNIYKVQEDVVESLPKTHRRREAAASTAIEKARVNE